MILPYGKTIQALSDEGVLKLLIDFRDTHPLDKSGNGNHGTLTATKWLNGGIKFSSTNSEVEVADAPELQGTEFGLAVLGDFSQQGSNERLLSKRDGGGTNFDFLSSTAGLNLYDGTNTRSINTSIIGKRFLAVNAKDGEFGEAFIDGLSIGTLTGASSLSANDAPLTIGNRFDGSRQLLSSLWAALVFSRRLTDTEWMAVYAELLAYQPILASHDFALADVSVDPRDPNLVSGWNMRRAPDGSVPDVSGNGNDGVPSGVMLSKKTILGNALEFDGESGYLDCGTGFNSLTDVTVSFWLNMTTIATTWPFSKFKNSSDAWGIRIVGTNLGIFDDIDNAGVNLYGTSIRANQWYHVVAQMVSLENKLYIDGELVGSGISSSGDWASFTGNLFWGTRSTASGFSNCQIAGAKVLNYDPGVAWVEREYRQGARALQFKTGFGAPVSVSPEGGVIGSYLSGTPVQFGDATVRAQMIAEEATIEGHTQIIKAIEWTVAGKLYLPRSLFKFASPTEMAFGLNELWFSKADASAISIIFVADQPSDWNAAGQDGYMMQTTNTESVNLWKIVNGGATALSRSAAAQYSADTWNRYSVARSTAGIFSAYLNRALVDSSVAGSNPTAADLVNVESGYVVFDFDAGDKLLYSSQDGAWGFAKYLGIPQAA